MSNADKIFVGVLGKQMEANQRGLLSLFESAGVPTDGLVRIRDLQRLKFLSPDAYDDAWALLFPETKANASSISLYKNGYENYKDRLDRLDIDPNYTYVPKIENFESVQGELVTMSYKSILKYIGIAVAVIAVGVGLWFLLKKKKNG